MDAQIKRLNGSICIELAHLCIKPTDVTVDILICRSDDPRDLMEWCCVSLERVEGGRNMWRGRAKIDVKNLPTGIFRVYVYYGKRMPNGIQREGCLKAGRIIL